jgi:SAM-dependent methyltransferase
MSAAAGLAQLDWRDGERAMLGDTVFELAVPHRAEDATASSDSFALLKDRSILDAYARYWGERPEFEAENVFEIGLWDGGSFALWQEVLEPRMHVGVDIADRRTPYFRAYESAPERRDQIRTFWDVDQTDKDRLRRIAGESFDRPLDLVLDDGAHLYRETKASMEALFGLLRPGGLYIIEDWAWGHWGSEFRLAASPERSALTRFVGELAGVVGSVQDVVAALDVRRHFVVVERGPGQVEAGLDLDRLRTWRRRSLGDSRVGWTLRRYVRAASARLGRARGAPDSD